MNNIIIHVGYPKTGTTWFQDNFYPYVENYKYFNREKFRDFFLSSSDNEFCNYSQKSFCKNNHILCEEEIININNGLSVEAKAEMLKASLGNPKIIIFIRNQFNILESKYSQYVKDGGTFTFEGLISHLFEINKIRQWDYYKQISLYKNIFGDNNVNVFLFEDFVSDKQSFITRYKEIFNFDISIEKINFSKKNESINLKLITLMREANKFSRTKIGFNRNTEKLYFHIPFMHKFSNTGLFMLNKVLSRNKFDSKNNLSEDLYKKLHNYYKESNKKLISEFNLDIERYNYPL